jgi:hypothetical protein
MLSTRWSIGLGRDWITGVAVTANDLIVVGTRGGLVAVLDQHGYKAEQQQMEAWVGAIEPFQDVNGDNYVLVGSKVGELALIALLTQAGTMELRTISMFRARNTVRSIASWTTADGLAFFAAGSEDRHAYIGRFDEAITEGIQAAIKPIEVNGWIRSVAFCFPRWGRGDPLVAAGCGDKRIYFISMNGEIVDAVRCDSKVHALAATRDGAKLYATSDSRSLFELNFSRRSKQVVLTDTKALPFRATTLLFMDQAQRELLVASEDGQLLLYDTSASTFIGEARVNGRIFSATSAWGDRQPTLFLGQEHGTLRSAAVSWAPHGNRHVTSHSMPSRLEYADIHGLASTLERGPVGEGIRVGIGRFLHMVAGTRLSQRLCIVGTDEGRVVVIAASRGAIEAVESFVADPDGRVWSVYGILREDEGVTIFASTSNRTVAIFEVPLEGTALTDSKEEITANVVSLPDWPREIRPTSDASNAVFAGCESGDVLRVSAHSEVEQILDGAGVIRTICVTSHDPLEIVVGTDDRYFALYRDGTQFWSVSTADRVREVISLGAVVAAVSEDHYLYVVHREGARLWRFRFPHRALCVAAIPVPDPDSDWLLAVGCGDGQVYFVTESGSLVAGYEFPDRIRDVVADSADSFIATSEDGYVYPAVTPSAYASDHWDETGTLLAQLMAEVRVQLAKRGFPFLDELPLSTRLMLVENFDLWRGPADDDVVLALFDSLLGYAAASANVCIAYRLAKAIVDFGVSTGQFAPCRSRLARLVDSSKDGPPYSAHASLRAVAEEEQTPLLRRLLDVVIAQFPRDDAWLSGELARALSDVGFFDIGRGGFSEHLITEALPLSRLSHILSSLEKDVWAGYADRAGMRGPVPSLLELWVLSRTPSPDRRRLRFVKDRMEAADSGSTAIMGAVQLIGKALTSPGPVEVRARELLKDWKARLTSRVVVSCIEEAERTVISLGYSGETHPALLADYAQRFAEREDPSMTSADFVLYVAGIASLGSTGMR